ncbi:hypothetical protein F4815DRAFT_441500 [Daldinia loculata]|nr:hypothetical protein F4815DRAFT_441500 [Daldinia loculata]
MVAYVTVLFAILGVSSAAQITGSCPSGQTLISNNKCCPGYAIVSGENHTDCCITEKDDPDYDQKAQDALSGTTASQSSSSPSSPADATPTASSTPSSPLDLTRLQAPPPLPTPRLLLQPPGLPPWRITRQCLQWWPL